MKLKKKKAYLESKQKWFDKLDQKTKNTMTRPGSLKTS